MSLGAFCVWFLFVLGHHDCFLCSVKAGVEALNIAHRSDIGKLGIYTSVLYYLVEFKTLNLIYYFGQAFFSFGQLIILHKYIIEQSDSVQILINLASLNH